nr:EOG090X0F3A [Eulimnadia texana]
MPLSLGCHLRFDGDSRNKRSNPVLLLCAEKLLSRSHHHSLDIYGRGPCCLPGLEITHLELGILIGTCLSIVLLLYTTARPNIEVSRKMVGRMEYLLVVPDRSLVFTAMDYFSDFVRNVTRQHSGSGRFDIVIDLTYVSSADYTTAQIAKILTDFLKMDLSAQAAELEQLELDGALTGTLNDEVYCRLLFVYFCQYDMCNAKLLWKRIPQEVKARCPLLAEVWTLGQKLWNQEHPQVFSLLRNAAWPEDLKPYAALLFESYRTKIINLIAKAYSSVHLQTFANILGLNEHTEEVEAVLLKLKEEAGWRVDAGAGLIIPESPAPPPIEIVSNAEQLEKLTNFVSFLEN